MFNNALSENTAITYSKSRNSENTNILSLRCNKFRGLSLEGLAEHVLWMELHGIDLSIYPIPNYGDKAWLLVKKNTSKAEKDSSLITPASIPSSNMDCTN